MVLSAKEIAQLVTGGFVKLEGAFSAATAAACRDVLWRDLKLTPEQLDCLASAAESGGAQTPFDCT